MPEIRNELHLSGSQPDIEKLINSVVTPNYPMMDFAKILPVPDKLLNTPALAAARSICRALSLCIMSGKCGSI